MITKFLDVSSWDRINYERVRVKGMTAGKIPLTKRISQKISPLGVGEPIPLEDRADGVDTSFWEGTMNFAKNPALKFACIKATQGTNIFDSQYTNSKDNLIALKTPWHSFHFLTVADALTQADWYLNHIKTNPGPIPPVVDVELPSVSARLIRTVVQRIYDVLQVWPMIYTSNYFWSLVYEELGRTDKQWIADRCKLWVAHYYTLRPTVPLNWGTAYYIHQERPNADGYAWGAQSAEIDHNWSRISWLLQFQPPAPPPIKTINSRGYTINIRNQPLVDPSTDVGDAKLVKAEVIDETTDWYKFVAWVAKSVTSEN